MCGISGFIGKKNLSPSKKKIFKTLNLMRNRGMDDFGAYERNITDKVKLNFNHSRLSIIDPSPNSNQPFFDNEGLLIFNGMIYNYLEIRKHLEKKKISFLTNSDTEVLLKYLNYYGEEKLQKLDGMWAFAYYNFKNKKVVLSRDTFGEKPLFYANDKNSFYFGSSLNYLPTLSSKKFKINYKKFENYLKFGFRTICNDNETFLSKVYSLEPGTNLIINKDMRILFHKYWKPQDDIKEKKFNYKVEKKILKNTYNQVLKRRLRSDFPSACLLSGGLDSSSIASLSNNLSKKKVYCFSVKPKDEDYDEDKYIKTVVKRNNINHTYVNIKKDNKKNLEHLKNVIEKTGNIVPTSTYLIFSLLCQKIKSKNFKVLLTGYGGDEMFSGYYIHQLHYLYSIKDKPVLFKRKFNEWSNYIQPLLRNEFLKNFDKYKEFMKNKKDIMFYDFMNMKKFFKSFKIKKNYKKINYFKNHLKNSLYKDIRYYSLPGQIAAVDNIAMYHGIENRTPFLSKDIFKKTFSYPNEYLINKGYGKFIFRDILRGRLDKTILQNRNKVGFFMNVEHMLNLRNKSLKKIIFSNKFIKSVIKMKLLNELLNKENKNNQESHLIFAILNTVFFIESFK